jgi:hypothetical protein
MAVQRISEAASCDDGYRAQLVDLADSHGSIYRRALDGLYEAERERLGEQAAFGDRSLLDEKRARERTRRFLEELEQAGMLASASESTARAIRAGLRAKLVRIAASDGTLGERLSELAHKRKGIYAEALAELPEQWSTRAREEELELVGVTGDSA